jgi:uncharacterized protein with GYD domain
MPIYILLSRVSQQGVQTLQSNPSRLQEVNRDVEELGAKVLHQWATLGEFDFVNVVEAPDTATIAKVSVALGARGSTRIQTLSALTIDEFVQPVANSSSGSTSPAQPRKCGSGSSAVQPYTAACVSGAGGSSFASAASSARRSASSAAGPSM